MCFIIAYSTQMATSISNFLPFLWKQQHSIKCHNFLVLYSLHMYKWVCFCSYFLVNVVVRKVNPYFLVLSVNEIYTFPFHKYSSSHVIKILLNLNISCNTWRFFNERAFSFVFHSFFFHLYIFSSIHILFLLKYLIIWNCWSDVYQSTTFRRLTKCILFWTNYNSKNSNSFGQNRKKNSYRVTYLRTIP